MLRSYFAIIASVILEWIDQLRFMNHQQFLFALLTTIFVVCVVYLLFRSIFIMTDVILLYLQLENEYALSIVLHEGFDKSEWDEIEDISDLVVGRFFSYRYYRGCCTLSESTSFAHYLIVLNLKRNFYYRT